MNSLHLALNLLFVLCLSISIIYWHSGLKMERVRNVDEICAKRIATTTESPLISSTLPPSMRQMPLNLSPSRIAPGLCEILVLDTGRMGNHLFSYVVTYLLGVRHHKQPCLSRYKAEFLSNLLVNVSLPTIVAPAWNQMIWQLHVGSIDAMELRLNKQLIYYIRDVPKAINLIEDQREVVVNKLLPIKSKFEDAVRDYYDVLKFKYSEKAVFIGVHIRLTDKLKFIQGLSGGGRPPMPKEIVYIMKYAKRDIQDKTRIGDENVVMVIGSDNVDWCRKYIKSGELNIEFTQDYFKHLPVGVSEQYFDFVALSRANHSVNNDGGTFSFWTSFLAGGEVYQPWDLPQQSRRMEMSIQIARTNLSRYHNVVIGEDEEQGEDKFPPILQEAVWRKKRSPPPKQPINKTIHV